MTAASNSTGDQLLKNEFDPHVPALLTIYVILAFLSLCGNTVVLITVIMCPGMKTPTFKLLANLSVSDLIFTVISPIHVHFMIKPWDWILSSLGDCGCKLYYFTFRSMYAVSVLTLVATTVERFRGIRSPLVKRQHPLSTRWIIVSIWIIAVAFNAPMLKGVTYIEIGDGKSCEERGWDSWDMYKVYHLAINVLLFVIPLTMMIILYAIMWYSLHRPPPGMTSQSKIIFIRRKTMANMLVLLVFSFFISWTGWTVMEAILIIKYPWIPPEGYFITLQYMMLPVFGSCALNAFLYGFWSKDFRKNSLKILTLQRPSIGRRNSSTKHTHKKWRLNAVLENNNLTRQSPTVV